MSRIKRQVERFTHKTGQNIRRHSNKDIYEKTYKSEIYGAWAYRCPHGISYHSIKKTFPEDLDVFVGVLAGKFKDISEVDKEWINSMKEKGANVIAIGKGKEFEIYELEKEVKLIHERQSEDFREMTLKYNGDEIDIVSGYDTESGEFYLTIVWNGAVDFEEYYTTKSEREDVISMAKRKYPEIADYIEIVAR